MRSFKNSIGHSASREIRASSLGLNRATGSAAGGYAMPKSGSAPDPHGKPLPDANKGCGPDGTDMNATSVERGGGRYQK